MPFGEVTRSTSLGRACDSMDYTIADTLPLFCRGGYFGRKTKTDVQLATLDPFWEEAFVPLSYLGTRSELENEILRVRVYDWDLFSGDDLIGKADVPLNGLLEYGQAS